MEQYLNEHDLTYDEVKHKGMVLTQTKTAKNSAIRFCEIYNKLFPQTPKKCQVYITKTKTDALDAYVNDESVLNNFVKGKTRVLVIIGRLLEGFDHNRVSVLGIVRNIAPTSRVLFAQFVGRAVRKTSPNDPVLAQIVTHKHFDQLQNYDTFEKLAEVDPIDDEYDYEEYDDDMMMITD